MFEATNKTTTMKFIRKHFYIIILALIFGLHIFFSFYNLERWASFDWDQIDNAWAALRILVAHKYPLIGMVAKANSGMYIGPLYYYLVALFYSLTRLNPIASPLLAGCTSIFSFFVLYYVSKQLFNEKTSLIACCIYTFSEFIIRSERSQWPVNFVAPLSLLTLYFLYKVVRGDPSKILPLAFVIGLSFQTHFTAIFYPLIILFSLPLFPKIKSTWKYIGLGLVIFLLFFAPQIMYYSQSKNTGSVGNYSKYFQTYYHGFHARRVLQLAHDAFIEFESVLNTPYRMLRNAVFFYIPIFIALYLITDKNKDKWKLPYLLCLWIIIPWFVFATYAGELTDYYFLMQLYIAVVVFAYITNWILDRKNILMTLLTCFFWIYFAYANVSLFFQTKDGDLKKNVPIVLQAVHGGRYIHFADGDPQSYFYYYLMYTQKHIKPYRL